MEDDKKKSWGKFITLGLSIGGAAAIGWINGSGVEKIVAEQTVEAIGQGDLPRIAAYAAIGFLLWIKVGGIEKQMKKMNETMTGALSSGELRFENIEDKIKGFEHRLTVIEEN